MEAKKKKLKVKIFSNTFSAKMCQCLYVPQIKNMAENYALYHVFLTFYLSYIYSGTRKFYKINSINTDREAFWWNLEGLIKLSDKLWVLLKSKTTVRSALKVFSENIASEGVWDKQTKCNQLKSAIDIQCVNTELIFFCLFQLQGC